MSVALRFRFALLVVAALVAACSDSSTGPSTPNVPDVASLIGEMSVSGIGSAVSVASPEVGLVFSASPTFAPANCVFTPSTGYFVCPTITSNGLTFTRMFRLLDAANNPQSKPSEQTVAIETKSTIMGTLTFNDRTSGTSTVAIDRSDDMTLSGIQTTKHTLNGRAATKIDGTMSTALGPTHVTTNQTELTTNIVLPNAKAGQRWPQSGSVQIDQTTSRPTASNRSRRSRGRPSRSTARASLRSPWSLALGRSRATSTWQIQPPRAVVARSISKECSKSL